MDNPILSLHHVTATVDDAQDDLDFYARLLGLRLVKKTVNFDNHNVYHFYYGTTRGSPGTIMTTFPYKGWRVPVGRKGAGQITVTSFSVPEGSLAAWRGRLNEHGVAFRDFESAMGEGTLEVRDPSDLVLQLVESRGDEREPWPHEGIDAGAAIRGLHSVSLLVREPPRTLELLTDVLGFRVVGEAEGRTRVAVNGDGAGKYLDIVEGNDAPGAINGLGTVHHVAFAITDEDEQLRMRNELLAIGLNVTEVRDRQYFRSIYFREPNGVLYEIATVPPGFTIDEDLDELGRALKLPPWEEPHRAAIEAGLPRIVQP
jgi:glyoxalase family protein